MTDVPPTNDDYDDEKLNNGLKVTTYRTIILILDHVFDKCIILHFSEATAY